MLERLCAAYRHIGQREDPQGDRPELRPVTVHIVDPQPGSGAVWRPDQSSTLCMNTLAAAVTLFTEPGASVSAPVVTGPTLYEWLQDNMPDTSPDLRPESHPSRADYGRYLQWFLDRVIENRPEGVTVEIHRTLATDIQSCPGSAEGVDGVDSADGAGRDRITLADGTIIDADTTVIAPGWTAPEPDAMESFMDTSLQIYPELTWIRPGNPCDQDVSRIPAFSDSGEEVLVRGLGMGFFDLMALVTIDRGGRFVADPSTRSGLRYEPSGQEPHLLVSSIHGYPYQPKPVYDSLPPSAQMPRFSAAVTGVTHTSNSSDAAAGTIDFGTTLWPAILRDAQAAYYAVLCGDDLQCLAQIEAVIDDPECDPWMLHLNARLDGLVPAEQRFVLPAHADPVRELCGTVDEFTERIADLVAADLDDARSGRESAVKAGLQVIGSARKAAAIADEPGRFTVESRRDSYEQFRRIGQMVGSGPPAFRTAELLCLVDAGFVRFLGSHPTVVIDPEAPAFLMSSETTGDRSVSSETLVDAWMHKPDVRTPSDPLTCSLKNAGRLRPWAFEEPGTSSGRPRTTRAPEVDRPTGLVVGKDGTVDPRVHLIGIPMQDVRADRTISPMPGSDPLFLQETDAAAVSALGIALNHELPPQDGAACRS